MHNRYTFQAHWSIFKSNGDNSLWLGHIFWIGSFCGRESEIWAGFGQFGCLEFMNFLQFFIIVFEIHLSLGHSFVAPVYNHAKKNDKISTSYTSFSQSQSPKVSTNPLRQWVFQKSLPFSWTTLGGKYCWYPIAIMGVVDTFKQNSIPIECDDTNIQ